MGKTSLSSAAAVAQAQKGLNTLLVTTDPASNLGDVFGQPVGLEPQPVEAVNGLFVQAIDSKASLAAYKERALAPLRVLFPETIVHAADEKMSGPCTEEVATFDQFIACLRNPAYDWVVFDTAPLRLLELPESWTVHISDSARAVGKPVWGLLTHSRLLNRTEFSLRNPQQAPYLPSGLPHNRTI
ncbi:hypothetical protein BXT84_07420 [Sulfobacillus thermotolerans]|uniref:ArsA/GET3 Anion-transporting ATPase-like domain-containing protein n=1 Tax=Sulfobacillus thermotolerans TaxID=338644 RepID=A0ABM6RR90_9FIRM|nr:hypothetical protein BXT84_07420 [Sulfobacillus thermotolerans]